MEQAEREYRTWWKAAILVLVVCVLAAPFIISAVVKDWCVDAVRSLDKWADE